MAATIDFCRKQRCGEDGLSKLVLLTLGFYCNWTSGETFVSVDTLAEECEVSADTIRRRLQHLQTLDLIEIEPRPGRSSIIRLKGYREWHETLPVKGATPSYQQGVATSKGSLPARAPLATSIDTPSYQRGEILNLNILPNTKVATGCEVDETRVWWENGTLRLCDSLNTFWLKQYRGSQDDLDLALLKAAGYIQPNSVHNLEKQVSSRLAGYVADRKDKDQRYFNAKNGNASQGAPVKTKSSRGWVKVEQGSPLFDQWLDVAKKHNKFGLISIFSKTGTLVVPPGDPETAWPEFLQQTAGAA